MTSEPAGVRAPSASGRRLVLLGVAALLSAAAALAIGILLFGRFGSTEGRILATTAIFAGYGLLTLPAAILRDRHRLPWLAGLSAALAVVAASLSVFGVWMEGAGDDLGRTIGTLTAWLVLSSQLSALTARRQDRDPRSVRRLLTVCWALAFLLGTMFTILIWAQLDSEAYGRVFAALVVLDVLLVVLQPVLARARRTESSHDLRVVVAPAEVIELTVEAPDRAMATARAVRQFEGQGRRVLVIELLETPRQVNGSAGDGLGHPEHARVP